MVRPVVLVLLLANLLFAGWAEWIDVPGPPPPSPIAGLPRLTLVSDLPSDKRAALARKMSLETPPPECVSVGPFDDPAIAARTVTLLRAKSFAPQQRAAEFPTVRRFWVYLDGFATDAAVTRVLHRLERAGIDDAEAMPPQTGGRRISLGLFTDHARAQRRAQAARAMGFRPAMTERMLPGTVYWLDLTLPSGSVPVPLKDVSYLEPSGVGSPISVQPCPSAPSTTTPSAQPQSPASPTLPRCQPGGGGKVPCVAADPKADSRPSVL